MYEEVRENKIDDGSQSLVCAAPACKEGSVTCVKERITFFENVWRQSRNWNYLICLRDVSPSMICHEFL